MIASKITSPRQPLHDVLGIVNVVVLIRGVRFPNQLIRPRIHDRPDQVLDIKAVAQEILNQRGEQFLIRGRVGRLCHPRAPPDPPHEVRPRGSITAARKYGFYGEVSHSAKCSRRSETYRAPSPRHPTARGGNGCRGADDLRRPRFEYTSMSPDPASDLIPTRAKRFAIW